MALGASPRRVLLGVFGRAGAQLGAGVLAGASIALIIDAVVPGGVMGGRAAVLLPAVVASIFAVGLLAAVGPARRSLAVPPAEALRDD